MPISSTSTDILGAFGGIGGLIVGVLGVVFGLRQRKEAARLRERAQAEKISAWAERRTEEGRRVIVKNPTDQIVRDVRVWLVTPANPRRRAAMCLSRPTRSTT